LVRGERQRVREGKKALPQAFNGARFRRYGKEGGGRSDFRFVEKRARKEHPDKKAVLKFGERMEREHLHEAQGKKGDLFSWGGQLDYHKNFGLSGKKEELFVERERTFQRKGRPILHLNGEKGKERAQISATILEKVARNRPEELYRCKGHSFAGEGEKEGTCSTAQCVG